MIAEVDFNLYLLLAAGICWLLQSNITVLQLRETELGGA